MTQTKQSTKRILAWVLTLALVFTMMPGYVLANEGDDTLGDFTLNGGVVGTDYSYTNNTLTITGNGTYTISGATTSDKILVAAGASPTITLNNASIDVSGTTGSCAFGLETGANVTLILSGTNMLKSGQNAAGLQTTLGEITIQGTGSLEATGGLYGAGIGGKQHEAGGIINITSGTITAQGGQGGAGIGGGASNSSAKQGSGGTISISGGTVNATGNTTGAGIGGGHYSPSGTISITGGTVTATGSVSGIGHGYSYTKADEVNSITVDYSRINDDSAVVTAKGADENEVAFGTEPNLSGIGSYKTAEGDNYTDGSYTYNSSDIYVSLKSGDASGGGSTTGKITSTETLGISGGNLTAGSDTTANATLTAQKGTSASDLDGTTKTWYYDSGSNKLYLNNFDFETSALKGLTFSDNVTIVLADGSTNSITSTCNGNDNSNPSCGIDAYGYTVTIQGSTGVLDVTGGTNTNGGSIGLRAKDLIISGGTVNATGGNAKADSLGVNVINSVMVSGGTLNAVGGTAGEDGDSIGIEVYGDITVSDSGKITAKGDNYAIESDDEPDADAMGTADGSKTPLAPAEWDGDAATYMLDTSVALYVELEAPSDSENYSIVYDTQSGKFTKDNGGDEYTAAGFDWNSSTNTLTLTNFTFKSKGDMALIVPDGTTVVLVGQNSIESIYDGSTASFALGALSGNLTISSDGGSLEAVGGKHSDNKFSAGIFAGGTLTIDGGTITASCGESTIGYGLYAVSGMAINGGNITADATASTSGYAVFVSDGSITMDNGIAFKGGATSESESDLSVDASGSTSTLVPVSAPPAKYAVSGSGGGSTDDPDAEALKTALEALTGNPTITVSGTTVTISVGTVTLTGNDSITIPSGITLVVDGGTVNIANSAGTGGIINNGTLNVSSGSINITGSSNYGICNLDGQINISGGSVTVANTTETGIGNLSDSGTGVINISGGTLAIANTDGTGVFNFGSFNISGGTITGTSPGNIVLGSGSKVKAPSGKFSDQGTSMTATGEVTVGSTNASVSASGLSAGTYTWNGTAFAKSAPATAPTITTTSLPNGTVGTSYSQTLAATGTATITWSVDSGSLPTGLTLTGNTISGTPTTAETQTFTIKATNSASSDTKSLSITINSVTEKPTPTTSDLNYTLTDTTYNKTPQSVTITPKTGVGEVTVKYNTSTTAPTNAGTYTITADIAEGTDYSAATGIVIGDWTITKRPITITADTKTKSIGTAEPTLTYNITSGSLLSGDTLTGGLTRRTGETVGVYAIISTLTNPNYAITYEGSNLTITSPTVPTPQIPTGGISGTVTDNSGSRDITVRIELGNKIAAGIIIDNAANPKTFSFTELIDGYYNIVVDNGIYKTTRIVEVKDGQSTSGIEMELGQKQSVVEVKPADSGSSTATPDVVVGGLDELFPTDDTTNETFTQEDKDVVAAGGTVEIKLIAIGKSEGNVTSDANKIKKIASGKTLSFMDFTVEKTQLNQDGDKIKNDTIPVLSDIITIIFPIPSYAKNTNGIKPGFAIYRVHEGSEESIPKGETNKNSDGEYFEIINDNIILKVKKFSTYAIGYTNDTTGGNQGDNAGGSTVTTNAQNPTIKTQLTDSTVAIGEVITLTAQASITDGGTLSYQWYVNTSVKNTGGTAIAGATKESYTVPTAKAGTYYYYVVVTNTNNSVNGSKTATATSDVTTITITENDIITEQFTVTYKKNGGGTVTGIPSDKTKYDSSSKVTVIGIPVSTSKFFAGWNTKADGTGKSYTAGKTFKITKDITLYAQWKNTITDSAKLKYKVTGKNQVACIETKDKEATSIVIGEAVKYKGITYKITSIAKNAFKGNDKITTVKIGNNVKIIDKKAFFKCTNLEKVTIGTGLITLNEHIFCHGKDSIVITINSTKLKTVKTSTNHGTKKMVIKVPKSKLDAYKKLFAQTSKTVMVEAKKD